jgi:alanine racemase
MKIAAGLPAGEAIVAGCRCPFAGRVSMDLIILDVTGVPEGALTRGAPVLFIGEDLTIDEVGRRAGTIGYEILTSLGRRYARTYRGATG